MMMMIIVKHGYIFQQQHAHCAFEKKERKNERKNRREKRKKRKEHYGSSSPIRPSHAFPFAKQRKSVADFFFFFFKREGSPF